MPCAMKQTSQHNNRLTMGHIDPSNSDLQGERRSQWVLEQRVGAEGGPYLSWAHPTSPHAPSTPSAPNTLQGIHLWAR